MHYTDLPSSAPLYCGPMSEGAVPDWDPASLGPGYLYVAMADHIEKRIKTGQLPKGSRLPGERDLAAEYGVATATARRATALLRDRGLVTTIPVKGSFVVGS